MPIPTAFPAPRGQEIVRAFVDLMNSSAITEIVRRAIHIHRTLAGAAKNAVFAATVKNG